MVRAAGLVMCLHPTTLLGLVLCLGQTVYTQNGLLPRPSIRAEPGPVIPRGQPVTIVCRSPAAADVFRLEKKDGNFSYKDQKPVSPAASQETQAEFHFPAVSDDTAGSYFCQYNKRPHWSEHSELLELKVTDNSKGGDGSTTRVYIFVGISVAFLLVLLLLVLLLVHRRRQKKHGSLHSEDKEQRPPERLSPAADIPASTPDVAKACTLPEKKRESHSPSPAAEDPQEVTYAQLDQRALTLRAAQAVSPQSTEPTADSNTYAAIARR